mgnify:CR=1 FL=1
MVKQSFAQTDIDAIMMEKNAFCVGPGYSYSSWKNYWEGELKKQNANLGRLNITNTLGRTGANGAYSGLYSFGARSFSIWHGLTGELIFDSKDFIDKKAFEMGKYPNGRSDDKGSEPEGITSGRVGNKNLLFVGLERANAVMIYDITNPVKPSYMQWLNTGVGPEGILFVSADKSPNGKSLFIASSETDGFVKIYTTN